MLRTEAEKLDLISRMIGGKAGEWIKSYGRISSVSWDNEVFTVTSMGGHMHRVPGNREATFEILFPMPADSEDWNTITGSPWVKEFKTIYRTPGVAREAEITVVVPAEKMEDNNEDSGCWKIKADSWSG